MNAKVDAPLERSNEVRDDGTACHWLAAILWAYEFAEGITDENPPVIGSIAPNGRELTEQMFDAVDDYHALLLEWPAPPHIEETMPVSAFIPGMQDGTPDAWAVTVTTLYLADLKYGFGLVEVWRNLQLIIYAWTLLCLHRSVQEVRLTIFQPRANHPDGPIRTWITSREELRPIIEAFKLAVARSLEPNPLCTVNSACGDCGAAHACKTLAAAGGAGVDLSYDSLPHILSNEEVAYELSRLEAAAKHIENRITGLSAQAESLVRSGQRVPGYGLSRSATRSRWREGFGERIEALGERFSVEVHAPTKLRSPAQLRHSFPGLDIESMYAERPTGELRLKATDPNEALKAFSKRRK